MVVTAPARSLDVSDRPESVLLVVRYQYPQCKADSLSLHVFLVNNTEAHQDHPVQKIYGSSERYDAGENDGVVQSSRRRRTNECELNAISKSSDEDNTTAV